MPDDDCLSPALEPAIATLLQALGAERVVVLDEFDVNRFDTPVAAFEKDRPAVSLPKAVTKDGVWGIYVEDPGTFLGWQFDDAQAIIAMTDAARGRADPADHFECFEVGEMTRSDWLNPLDFWTSRL